MSEIRVNNLSNESSTGGPTISGITTFSGTNFFVPPVGNTAQRPQDPQKGAIRFNTDTKHLEYYRGDTIGWSEVEASNEELDGCARGVYGPGEAPHGDTIEYITISTLGDSVDFGNLSVTRFSGGCGGASRTRGIFAGGQHPSPFSFKDEIDYITISSTGNATDFGNLLVAAYDTDGISNSTRGIINPCTKSGFTLVNTLEYITIAATGNSVDFGDLSHLRRNAGPLASSTRACFGGGSDPSNQDTVIDYVTISTLGDATDFGDMNGKATNTLAGSNSTRGLFAGGETPSLTNKIDYITIATTGNAADLGDLTVARQRSGASTSPTRCVFGGGSVSPTYVYSLDYVEILTTGNAVDFGNLVRGASRCYGAFSNAHGGL